MSVFSDHFIASLIDDADARETRLRDLLADELPQMPPVVRDDAVIATYFLALRSLTLEKAVKEIAYHATSGIKNPPPGSLLAACTAESAGARAFDAAGRVGLLRIAFPLKMMLDPEGRLTSVDLLHTLASAVIFDMYENLDARLLAIDLPEAVLQGFPGPAHGPQGARRLARFPSGRPAFGTILKPTAGITPEEVGRIVASIASWSHLMFIKEDEDLYPDLPYSPVAERVRHAKAAIARVRDAGVESGLVYLPHCTATPHRLGDLVEAALEAGADGVMFSESFAGGAVRMIREAHRERQPHPPLIYGHNAGIGVKTRGGIAREVVDFLARLDGIDFRQTAPIKVGDPYIRPFGREWRASEEILSRPLPGINPVMIARAGGLDQGNLLLNIDEVEAQGRLDSVLFLAGSAINSIVNDQGEADPALGIAALAELLDLRESGAVRGVPPERHLDTLRQAARAAGHHALIRALDQRYPNR